MGHEIDRLPIWAVVPSELPSRQNGASVRKHGPYKPVVDSDGSFAGVGSKSLDRRGGYSRGPRRCGRPRNLRRVGDLLAGRRRLGRRHGLFLRHRDQPLVRGEDDKCKNYCEEKAAFHQLRNRVEPRASKWVAAENTFETYPPAATDAVRSNRLCCIFRARRQIPARPCK